MTYRNAVKLHSEDEVIVKATGAALTVVDIEVDDSAKAVFIRCSDGNLYHHRALK